MDHLDSLESESIFPGTTPKRSGATVSPMSGPC